MTSATERLRALLDERGVEHESTEWIDGTTIKWHGSDGIEYSARNGVSFDGPTGRLVLYGITPEQAIAATLGPGTCRDTALEGEWFECSECGTVKQLIHPHYCPNCGRRVVEP